MATQPDLHSKPFRPGIGEWTVDELDQPVIEELWSESRFELIEGVITEMPPAYFDGSRSILKLAFLLMNHSEAHHLDLEPAHECDLVLSEDRLAVADLIVIRPAELRRSRELAALHGKIEPARQRIYFPPALIAESVSYGHEARDRKLKRRWYAEFGVPSYWILDALSRSLECLTLENGHYVQQAFGKNTEILTLKEFGGLTLDLTKIWPRD